MPVIKLNKSESLCLPKKKGKFWLTFKCGANWFWRRVKNWPKIYLFDLSEQQPNFNHKQNCNSGRTSCSRSKCIGQFCFGNHFSFQGFRNAKNDPWMLKNFWCSSFSGSGLTFLQIAMVKSIRHLENRGNNTFTKVKLFSRG